MGQLTAYSSVRKFMLPELPGLRNAAVIDIELQKAGREFCRRTGAWREELRPIAVVDYQGDYLLYHGYDASVHRIEWVRVNQNLQDASRYDLKTETLLRWAPGYAPYEFDDMLLVCATSPLTAYGDWTGITDSSLTIEVSSGSYGMTEITFADCTSMDDVALEIQTAWRASMASNHGNVRWYTDHFRLWLESGEMSYLTAGSAGTDISGASYMNGLTGAGTLAPMIEAEVRLRPQIDADTLPDWFFDRWAETIIAGAMVELLKKPGPWRNPDLADSYRVTWRRGVSRAKGEDAREYKSEPTGFEL